LFEAEKGKRKQSSVSVLDTHFLNLAGKQQILTSHRH